MRRPAFIATLLLPLPFALLPLMTVFFSGGSGATPTEQLTTVTVPVPDTAATTASQPDSSVAFNADGHRPARCDDGLPGTIEG